MLSMMKKVFALLFILSSLPVWAEDIDFVIEKYNSQIKNCDKEQENLFNSDKSLTTIGIKEIYQITTNCYKEIAYNIINTHYSKNANELKTNFDTHINSIHQLQWDILWLYNGCPDNCGSILDIKSQENAVKQTKLILQDFLNALQWFKK